MGGTTKMRGTEDLVIGKRIPSGADLWNELIELAGPSSILVVIRARMSRSLLARTTPADVWQESLLKAWTGRAECVWHGPRPFRAWLLRIVENTIREVVDRETAKKRTPEGVVRTIETLHQVLSSATPGRIAVYDEQAELMETVLASLDEDEREIVRLRLFEELELKEIAMRLSMNLATCKSRFRRGAEEYHRRLRAALRTRSGS
jgi:RNA polymerase sigma factor (sigma-70 family)